MTEAASELEGQHSPAAHGPVVEKGLIGALFDFSFQSFITPKLIQVVFVVLIALGGLMTLSLILTAFGVHAGVGVVALLLAPVIFLLNVAAARISLELVIVIFRIYESLRDRPL